MTHPRRLVCFHLVVFAMFARVAGAAAQDDVPRVTLGAPVHDFGTVEQGTTIDHAFRLRNVGRGVLRIDQVKGTCACTASAATGSAVAPGDEAWVTVSLDTSHLVGRTTKAVTVYTNDPAAPRFIVTLTGTVLADLVAQPTPLYVGRVPRGTPIRREVLVWPGRPGAAATVVSVETSNPRVRASIAPAIDGSGQRVVVEIGGDFPVGRFNDELVLRTSSTRQPTLVVKILGIVEDGPGGTSAIAPASGLAALRSLSVR